MQMDMNITTHTAEQTAAERSYTLHPDSAPYRQGIFDVIRIFMPEFAWSDTDDASLIAVNRDEDYWCVQIGEASISFPVSNLDENERRKRLKQELYLYFALQYGGEHPWGIMTGIRPTKIVHRYRDAGLEDDALKETLIQEYFLKEEKADLLTEVSRRQRPFLPSVKEAREKVSLYVSIPFCPTRCHYCSFPSFCLPKPHLQEMYLDNLIKECRAVGAALKDRSIEIQTVYVGGGTPTSLNAVQLARLLASIRTVTNNNLEEFTVEAGRPDTITEEKLQILHDLDVGRISINPQTFSQSTLDRIGRRHTVQDLFDVYRMARSIGFDCINMDLIAGLTGETIADFQHSLEQISILKPENLTVHTLAIKRTAKLVKTDLDNAQADTVTAMNRYLKTWLETERYVPYYLYRQKQMIGDMENTGFCMPDKESIYNILMMEERQTILGLGVGATSKYVNPSDWTLIQKNNPKDLYFYNERIEELIEKKLAQLSVLFPQ